MREKEKERIRPNVKLLNWRVYALHAQTWTFVLSYCCTVVLLFLMHCILWHSFTFAFINTDNFSFWIIYYSVSLVCCYEYFIAIFVFHFQTKFDFKWMRSELLPDQQLFACCHIQNSFEFISIEQIKSLMSQNCWPNVCSAFNSFSLI